MRNTREEIADETFAGNVMAFRMESISAEESETGGECNLGGRGGGGVAGSILKTVRGGGGRGPAVECTPAI